MLVGPSYGQSFAGLGFGGRACGQGRCEQVASGCLGGLPSGTPGEEHRWCALRREGRSLVAWARRPSALAASRWWGPFTRRGVPDSARPGWQQRRKVGVRAGHGPARLGHALARHTGWGISGCPQYWGQTSGLLIWKGEAMPMSVERSAVCETHGLGADGGDAGAEVPYQSPGVRGAWARRLAGGGRHRRPDLHRSDRCRWAPSLSQALTRPPSASSKVGSLNKATSTRLSLVEERNSR